MLDLKSTHGSFVNRQRIGEDYVRVEQGDIMQFGESTRIYTLSDFQQEESSEDEGVNWGMDSRVEDDII